MRIFIGYLMCITGLKIVIFEIERSHLIRIAARNGPFYINLFILNAPTRLPPCIDHYPVELVERRSKEPLTSSVSVSWGL